MTTPSNGNGKQCCLVCGKEFSKKHLFPTALMRPSFFEFLRKNHNNCDNGYICPVDLRKARSDHIENLLEEERGQLSELDQEVLESIEQHDLLTEDISKKFETGATFGERLADRVAKFGGSWTFIVCFFSLLLVWMGINSYILLHRAFDPYPYILLNLFLSCLAAIQAPVIMMSQNRQATKDHLRDNDDYRTNLKTELEIRQLHAKMDLFTKKQWERLMEIQKIQIELAEDLLHHPRD
ncbi:MAG: DUF1003 domain-containing protein [Candidatus Algichlamydia australiensis]|nr:DUF1003 domain-containing protein [Chlamydiales bacterium]